MNTSLESYKKAMSNLNHARMDTTYAVQCECFSLESMILFFPPSIGQRIVSKNTDCSAEYCEEKKRKLSPIS